MNHESKTKLLIIFIKIIKRKKASYASPSIHHYVYIPTYIDNTIKSTSVISRLKKKGKEQKHSCSIEKAAYHFIYS